MQPERSIRYPDTIELSDATTKQPILEEAQIELRNSMGETMVSFTGRRSVRMPLTIPDGTVFAMISIPGYEVHQHKFIKFKDVSYPLRKIVLSPLLAENAVRVVLTWNKTPRDLDLHCVDSEQHHSYFSNKKAGAIELDVDETSGYGPETITMTTKPGVKYCIFVKNFSGEHPLCTSGAQLKVYGLRGVDSIRIPSEAADSNSRYWDILAIDEDGSPRIVNKIVNATSDTHLF